MKTLLGITIMVAAASLAWGHSEYERARYFANQASIWKVAYQELEDQSPVSCVVEEDGKPVCFVDLPPGQ